jgi:uncharacterized protein (DUF427 family)
MFKWIGDEIANQAEQVLKEEREDEHSYYVSCPRCGKKQVRKNLLDNGCFICGWKGTEEDIELARAKRQSGTLYPQRKEMEEERAQNSGYKTYCPHCGTSVITEEFLQNGCWRCGYKE